jgi:hypothetical protein
MSRPQNNSNIVPLKKAELKESIHFYYTPEGYMVFTELYLKQRGYCCKNGCRHCPYDYAKSQEH